MVSLPTWRRVRKKALGSFVRSLTFYQVFGRKTVQVHNTRNQGHPTCSLSETKTKQVLPNLCSSGGHFQGVLVPNGILKVVQ